MPDDEKDRYGDRLRDAEKAKEDQFFAERERELLAKLKARTGEQPGESTPAPAENGDVGKRETPAGAVSGWLARLFGRSR